MHIKSDIIIFTVEDFDGLSDSAKKALSVYLEDYAAFFSAGVNREIDRAKAHVNSLRNSAILTGLATADEATMKEAESLLVQLDVLLAPKPEPEVVVAEVKPEVVVAEVKPEVVLAEVKPEVAVAEVEPEVAAKVKPEEVVVEEVKSEVADEAAPSFFDKVKLFFK